MPIIEDLITKEKVDEADSAYLGIVGVDVTSDVAKTYNMPTGVYVAQVKENSAAEQAGIQKGDIITAFDGKDVSSMEDLSSKLQYYKAGTTVDVTSRDLPTDSMKSRRSLSHWERRTDRERADTEVGI